MKETIMNAMENLIGKIELEKEDTEKHPSSNVRGNVHRKEKLSNNNILDDCDKMYSIDCMKVDNVDNLKGDLIDFKSDENKTSNKNIFQDKREQECGTENLSKNILSDDSDTSKENHPMRTTSELETLSLKELKLLVEDLASSVKEVSSELVQLLQENDMLQQESDARNIAIEQLLKLTVTQTETDVRPVQMSVIIPPVSNDDWD